MLLSTGLFAFPFVHNYALLAIAIACIPVGTAFTFPCVTSMLSRVIPATERGLYMGVQQAYGGIARVVIPIWADSRMTISVKTCLSSLPRCSCWESLHRLGVDDGRKVGAGAEVASEPAVS